MGKSIIITYLLWLFGGYFGLHHFYLRRDKQALLWWCFPGGYFGAGWLRDLWRIPEYVRDANDDPEYLRRLAEKIRKNKKPPFSLSRFIGQLLVGNVFGIMVMLAVPGSDEIGVDIYILGQLIAPTATAIGIWVVGNIGREKGSIKYPLIGCYCAFPLFFFGIFTYSIVTFIGTVVFQWKAKQWRRTVREPASLKKRLLILTLCGTLYVSLWGSYVYFNMRIVTNDGDEIKFRDAIGNFLRSPAVQEFSKNVGKLWDHCWEHGFWSTLNQLLESLDPLGEKHALRVLELRKGSSQADIRSRCRELSKKWHPDKFQSQDEKEEAQSKFVEVQAACEKLSQIKKRRKEQNSQSHLDEPEETEDRDEL